MDSMKNIKLTPEQIDKFANDHFLASNQLFPEQWRGFARAIAAAARAEAIEECAKWYSDKGWLLDEDAVPDAIRALLNTDK